MARLSNAGDVARMSTTEILGRTGSNESSTYDLDDEGSWRSSRLMHKFRCDIVFSVTKDSPTCKLFSCIVL